MPPLLPPSFSLLLCFLFGCRQPTAASPFCKFQKKTGQKKLQRHGQVQVQRQRKVQNQTINNSTASIPKVKLKREMSSSGKILPDVINEHKVSKVCKSTSAIFKGFFQTFCCLQTMRPDDVLQHCRQDKAALIQTHRIMNIHHLA